MNVLVVGGKGQLGQCIQDIVKDKKELHFDFVDFPEIDITQKESIANHFNQKKYDYCINCAAYTAVDKAETETEIAHQVNAIGAQNLAQVCTQNDTTLIHISTDFVFDGTATKPYTETDAPNPISVYGKTKLEGEVFIQNEMNNYFILRTAWLYSEHANNFMKTILKLAADRDELNIIADQYGTPTYAKDLAQVILKIIETKSQKFGLYHYSNSGEASWYDFAKEIFTRSHIKIKLGAIPTTQYPTPAERPKYSVMDKTKIKTNLGITIPEWQDSLQKALTALSNI